MYEVNVVGPAGLAVPYDVSSARSLTQTMAGELRVAVTSGGRPPMTATFTTSQVNVTATTPPAAPILPADTVSATREITNAGTTTVFIGGSNVTATTGYPVPAGARLPLTTSAAIYGVTASGTAMVGTLTGA